MRTAVKPQETIRSGLTKAHTMRSSTRGVIINTPVVSSTLRFPISKNQSPGDKRGKKFNPPEHTSTKTKKILTTTTNATNELIAEEAIGTTAVTASEEEATTTTSPTTGPSRSTFNTRNTSVRNKAKISS